MHARQNPGSEENFYKRDIFHVPLLESLYDQVCNKSSFETTPIYMTQLATI